MAQGDPQGWESLGVNDPLLYKANLRLNRETGVGQTKQDIKVVTNRDNGNYDVYSTAFGAGDKKLFGYNASDNKIVVDPNNKATYDQFFTGPRSQQLTDLNKSVKQATLKLAENNVSGGSGSASQAALDRLKNGPGYKPTAATPKITPPGAGQGQNAPIPGVAGSTSGGAGGVSDADFKAGISDSKKTRSQFPTLKYPETLDAGKQDVIKFSMLKYSPKAFQTTKDNLGGFADRPSIGKDRNAIGVVTLPIPNGISDSNTLNWGDTTMNAAEALAANLALSGIKGGGQGLTDTAGEVAGAVQSNSGEVAGGMPALFAGLAVQGNAASILQRTEGAVINPNLELLFNAPTLRPFNFTFKLASRSETESKIIRSIIRFFKQGSAAQKSESNLFLKAPHTFQIQYLHNGKPHNFLNQFKECALQSFGVSYTPEGQYATFNDGAMVSYQITMQFQELEPIFNEDYTNDGTNPSPDIGF
jgi:hypothetical protein